MSIGIPNLKTAEQFKAAAKILKEEKNGINPFIKIARKIKIASDPRDVFIKNLPKK